ncbi:uncharacterized protein MYCFIDRAFT_205968 [Pseudocercospora fijiensis CIRAD86]|uniref:Uncharacterized protein n=1 Tax=Pseudocercospora fijiensis (strain CIRAD86) TaxID=383855 RepID=N1QB41_PSEFD|nr:uncharacterized protein MYCFIDRAFT_205968 [Pseudocercospora fijiensis CIRAD86]EME88278.1 hypothetical protein MYCFIDRAFT_205968 [Pseudocercospora fijiensis CIRAD86]
MGLGLGMGIEMARSMEIAAAARGPTTLHWRAMSRPPLRLLVALSTMLTPPSPSPQRAAAKAGVSSRVGCRSVEEQYYVAKPSRMQVDTDMSRRGAHSSGAGGWRARVSQARRKGCHRS